jgi:hypothetical protein
MEPFAIWLRPQVLGEPPSALVASSGTPSLSAAGSAVLGDGAGAVLDRIRGINTLLEEVGRGRG